MRVTFFANCFGTMALCIASVTDLRQNSSESSLSNFRLNLNVCKVGNCGSLCGIQMKTKGKKEISNNHCQLKWSGNLNTPTSNRIWCQIVQSKHLKDIKLDASKQLLWFQWGN